MSTPVLVMMVMNMGKINNYQTWSPKQEYSESANGARLPGLLNVWLVIRATFTDIGLR